MRRLAVRIERWPIAGAFTIARGSKTEAEVVVTEITDGPARGRGEAVPYRRYHETVSSVVGDVEDLRPRIEAGCDRQQLQALLAPGAARNALDCALWDLEAKQTGVPVWSRAGLAPPHAVETAYTISLGAPAAMAKAARLAAARPILKLKIGGGDDIGRVAAVRIAVPHARLIVDANEALTIEALRRLAPELARLGVGLIEQPLKAGEEAALDGYECPVPLCADESLHTREELAACEGRYACVNVKLDKTGGLTEALALAAEARAAGFQVMAGCMVATSLAMAPAILIAQDAAFVDLDGPLLLKIDREPGLTFDGSTIEPPSPDLWG